MMEKVSRDCGPTSENSVKEMTVSNRHHLLVDALEHYSNRIKEKLGKFVFTLYYFEHFHIWGWFIIYW